MDLLQLKMPSAMESSRFGPMTKRSLCASASIARNSLLGRTLRLLFTAETASAADMPRFSTRYAMATAAERELPERQHTATLPPPS